MKKLWFDYWFWLLVIFGLAVVGFDIWVNESWGEKEYDQYGLGFVLGWATCNLVDLYKEHRARKKGL